MDEWDEGMEYMEDAAAEEAESIEDAAEARDSDDIEKVREALDILIQDRLARQDGEKPAKEWTRTDFSNTLRNYKKLRNLTTPELRALFLHYVETIHGVAYYRRDSVRDVRRYRSIGGSPAYALAIPVATAYAVANGDEDACRQLSAEEKKLAKVWQEL